MKKIVTFFVICFSLNIMAQDIHIRTIPLVTADKAGIYPSVSAGMGYLSIVIHDSLSDPFINPAAVSRLSSGSIFISPSRSTWSNANGRAVSNGFGLSTKYTGTDINTLPFGFYLNSHGFFAGGVFAHQSYSSERFTPKNWSSDEIIKKDKGNNTYAFGLAGAYIPALKVAIAGSITWKDFKAIDGVNILYPGSYDITQDGWFIEYKIGAFGKLSEKDEIEFVIGRSTMKSSHEVTAPLFLWNDIMASSSSLMYISETNKDETDGWLIHTKYNYSISNKWTLGGIITVNWKEHPKIPNYALANIPRDPGNSTAYNLGAGAVYNGEQTTAGFEYIYEPVSSYTWAEAGDNAALPPLFKTIENYFEFTNHIVRAGLKNHTGVSWLDYTIGIQFHFYKYNLKQNDNINVTSRNAGENWLEATLTGGLNFSFPGFRLLYSMQVTLGNGIVTTDRTNLSLFDSVNNVSDFLVAPSGAIVIEAIPVITQQLSVIYQL